MPPPHLSRAGAMTRTQERIGKRFLRQRAMEEKGGSLPAFLKERGGRADVWQLGREVRLDAGHRTAG